MKRLLVLTLMFSGCGPQWVRGDRTRTNLCELAATVDDFTLATVEQVHEPREFLVSGAELGQPSGPGQLFWGTRIDWAGERMVAARGGVTSVEARFSTVYAGPFNNTGAFIIGRSVRSEWVDLHADAMFSLGAGGWRRAGHEAAEVSELAPALSAAFSEGAVSGCENYAGGDL